MLAGAFAALAMLGKYYSIVLLATLFCVLLVHPDRGRVLRSPALLIAALAGAVVLAPHAWWLWERREIAFAHAVSRTTFDPDNARLTTARSVIGGLMTLAGPVLLSPTPSVPISERRCASSAAELWPPRSDPCWCWPGDPSCSPCSPTSSAMCASEANSCCRPSSPCAAHDPPGRQLGCRCRPPRNRGGLAVLAGGAVLAPIIGVLTYQTARHPLLEPRPELAASRHRLLAWRDQPSAASRGRQSALPPHRLLQRRPAALHGTAPPGSGSTTRRPRSGETGCCSCAAATMRNARRMRARCWAKRASSASRSRGPTRCSGASRGRCTRSSSICFRRPARGRLPPADVSRGGREARRQPEVRDGIRRTAGSRRRCRRRPSTRCGDASAASRRRSARGRWPSRCG